MNRRTKTLLPSTNKLLKPKIITNVPQQLADNKKRQAYHYDKRAKDLPPLTVGETVRVRPMKDKVEWKKAIVTRKKSEPRSYEVMTQTGKKIPKKSQRSPQHQRGLQSNQPKL